MDAKHLVSQYKDDLIDDLIGLLSIYSVRGEPVKDAPVGEGPKKALEYMIDLGGKAGLPTKVVDNLAGHIEFGAGEKLFGVLGHVDVVPAG